MQDEMGLDSKVVVSLVSPDGKAAVALTPDDQRRIGDFFNRYKRHASGKPKARAGAARSRASRTSRVHHRFFLKCRDMSSTACHVN